MGSTSRRPPRSTARATRTSPTRRALRRELADALGGGGVTILEVRTERDANVALHRRVWDAVAAALRG